MSPISLEALEQRVATLEQTVGRLLPPAAEPIPFKDWRQAIGLLECTELAQAIDEAGRQIREADRQAAP